MLLPIRNMVMPLDNVKLLEIPADIYANYQKIKTKILPRWDVPGPLKFGGKKETIRVDDNTPKRFAKMLVGLISLFSIRSILFWGQVVAFYSILSLFALLIFVLSILPAKTFIFTLFVSALFMPALFMFAPSALVLFTSFLFALVVSTPFAFASSTHLQSPHLFRPYFHCLYFLCLYSPYLYFLHLCLPQLYLLHLPLQPYIPHPINLQE